MKYNIFCFILILFASVSQGQETGTLLEQANQQYMGQQYTEAAALYEQILHSGKASAQVYYNLGNCYYKSGDILKAILNYERAKQLAPQDEDIDFNLRIVNQFVVDNIEALPQPFFIRWKASMATLTSSDGWAKISIFSFFAFLILMAGYLFSRILAIKRLAFWSAIVFSVLFIVSLTFAYQQYSEMKKRRHAIVFCPRVTVKSSPSASGADLFLIHEGLKLEITDSLNIWKEIRLADGNKGWLPDSCLVRI